jgi:hypothetical protein
MAQKRRKDKKRKTGGSLQSKARAGFRGYPVATVAYYGPDNQFASKAVVGIIHREGEETVAMKKWFSGEVDARLDPLISKEIVEFIEPYRAKSVILPPRIIGCPHEEGIDYPLGERCPECTYWATRDRWAGLLGDEDKVGAPVKMVTGVGWYRPEQWERLREVSVDRDDLADTWEEWERSAQDALRQMGKTGMVLEKVDVDVEDLVAWCQAQGREVSGETRVEYVTLLTQQRHQAQ